MVVLTLAQSKLRDQVNGLVERMNSRLVVSDPSFKKIAELLPKAAEQMTAAEKKLQAQSPDGALPPENLALQFLQQAEEEFELQVQTGRQAGGGGGGGGAGSIAERPGRLVQDGNGQDGEPVRDQLAGLVAAAGSADRRAGREAEGAGAPAGAGNRTAAPAWPRASRPAATAATCSARSPSRPKKRRASSRSCRAIRSARTSPTPRGSCATPPTR